MNREKSIVIAVDGPAGSGKSSVCRQVALELGIKYVDSGALYRSITFFYLNKYGSVGEIDDLEADLAHINIVQNFNDNGTIEMFLNSQNVSREIRDETITKNIGFFSDKPVVRDFVTTLLRAWGESTSIIMDGRDIGSVVFPHAHLKVYLDASVDIRARRRVKEYVEMGKKVDEKSIRNQIIQRDFEDMNREFGALKKAPDAVFLDSSDMSFREVVDVLKSKIEVVREQTS